MYVFGPGVLIGTLNGVADPTPVNIGYAQKIAYSEKSKNKSLFGQNRRALAVGAGTIEATVKVTAAKFSGVAISTLLNGVAPTTGGTFAVIAEAHNIPSVTTYTITPAPPNTGTYSGDLGVIYATSGKPMTRVASGPTIGEYSLAAGVYTFAAADEGVAVLVSYEYTASAYGQSIPSTNPLLGATVSFAADITYTDPTTNLTATLHLFNCVFNDFSLSTGLEDFAMPELTADCFANAAGNAYQWNIPDNL